MAEAWGGGRVEKSMTFEGPRCRDRLELSQEGTPPLLVRTVQQGSQATPNSCLLDTSHNLTEEMMTNANTTLLQGLQQRCRRNAGAHDRRRSEVCGSVDEGSGQTVGSPLSRLKLEPDSES